MHAIEEIYLTYRDSVYRYLCSLTRDAALAEDLLSETFLHALQSLHTFRGKSSVKTWLCTIARNAWVDYLRRARPQLSYDDLLVQYVAESAPAAHADTCFECAVDTRDLAQRAVALLATRKPPAGKILTLRAQGYAFAEIAAQCDISENSARTLDFRTRAWLREQLQTKEGL